MYNIDSLRTYLVAKLQSSTLKYQINDFPSGACIIDIWKANDFYVIHLENNSIGFSTIGDDADFSTIPDRRFYDEKEFEAFLDLQILK